MASTFYSDQYYKPIPGTGAGGDMKVFIGSYEFTSITVINDVVTMFTMPKGFTPLYGYLLGDPIDANAIETLELDVGIAGDTTKYLDSGVITTDTVTDWTITDAIHLPLQEDLLTVKPTELTADTDLIVTVTAAAATTGTGTIKVYMFGVYNDPRVA